MDPPLRGVRFQGYSTDPADQEDHVSRNQTPVPVPRTNANATIPGSPRPRTTVPIVQQQQQQQQQQQNMRATMQGYFPNEPPIDYNIPSLVEEGGFPFETPTPGDGP